MNETQITVNSNGGGMVPNIKINPYGLPSFNHGRNGSQATLPLG